MQRGVEILTERFGLEPGGRFAGEEVPWRSIADSLAAGFLMGPRRIVTSLYRNAVPADHAKGLKKVPAGQTVFCGIFWLKKLPFKVPKAACSVSCPRPDDTLLARWARKEFSLREQQISSDALHNLVGAGP